jgi:plasmid stabilization system protein ParE
LEIDPSLAQCFVDQIEGIFSAVSQEPNLFPKIEVNVSNTSREWRRALLKRFPYVLVYFVEGDNVIIAAIAHASRDWTSSLSDDN